MRVKEEEAQEICEMKKTGRGGRASQRVCANSFESVVGRLIAITWVLIGGIPRPLDYSPEKTAPGKF